MTGTRGRDAERSIAHNPYSDVDWAQADQCRSQFHVHEPRNPIDPESTDHGPMAEQTATEAAGRPSPRTLIDKYDGAGYGALAITEHEYYVDGTKHKGEPFREDLDTTSWPWSRWGREGGPGEMVPVQGAELRGRLQGLDRLHDIVSLGADLGHGRGRSLRAVAATVADRGGVSFLPHPGKYVDPDDVGAYPDLFAGAESLFGLEIFNARDRYPSCRAIWDALLAELGPRRPVWAVANDDYHGRPRPAGSERFDQSRTVLLLAERSPSRVIDALASGRSYVQHDGDGTAPRIEAITVDGTRVRLDAPSAATVTWISDGTAIAAGPELVLEGASGQYVRAEAVGQNGGISCTQPLYLD